MATERRAVELDLGFTSPTAPADRPLSTSGLKRFASVAAYLAFVNRAAVGGDEFFDTNLNVQRIYNGTSWVSPALGGGAISEAEFTMANNQVAAANVTGLLLDATLWRSARVRLDISRRDTVLATELRWVGFLELIYRQVGTTWAINGLEGGGDVVSDLPAGITFTITAAGQVKYQSTNEAGSNRVEKLTFSATMTSKGAA